MSRLSILLKTDRLRRSDEPLRQQLRSHTRMARNAIRALLRHRWPSWVSDDARLLPPYRFMLLEGTDRLEWWFRWADHWDMLLRIHGRMRPDSTVLDIGCGLGRIAFPLRHYLGGAGRYHGFDIERYKIRFLRRNFQAAFPNFRFHFADIRNTYYNPRGQIEPTSYRFPVRDGSCDLVFAASVFTHMQPANMAHYFRESARVLRPGGRCVFSFFLLDYYRPGHPRPGMFSRTIFNFDHHVEPHGSDFAVVFPNDPERMTAYRAARVEATAEQTGLRFAHPPLAGHWSGTVDAPLISQDLVVLEKPA